MKKETTYKVGDKIITTKKIISGQTWVRINKGVEGKIVKRFAELSKGIRRWIVKFKNDPFPVIVFETEMKKIIAIKK